GGGGEGGGPAVGGEVVQEAPLDDVAGLLEVAPGGVAGRRDDGVVPRRGQVVRGPPDAPEVGRPAGQEPQAVDGVEDAVGIGGAEGGIQLRLQGGGGVRTQLRQADPGEGPVEGRLGTTGRPVAGVGGGDLPALGQVAARG